MKSLELKVPPAVVLLACGAGMWLVARAAPAADVTIPARWIVAVVPFAVGIGLGLRGVLAFRRHRTTVHPSRPETASAVVTSDVYRFTRNPMYLGLALVLCAWAVVLENLAAPLGVLAPVDGVVTEITGAGPGILDREAVRVTMRINNFGAYTARSPIEGKVLDPRDNLSDHSRWLDVHGMWVRSDEDDDVVVLIHGPKWLGAPKAFLGYGERVGQGQRFAFMRLARTADVYLPADAHVRVKTGQSVRAGTDSLAELRHR